jgi:hypothetical protein
MLLLDVSVTTVFVNVNQISQSIPIDIGPAEVGTVIAVGEFDLRDTQPCPVVVLGVAGHTAVLLDTEIICTLIPSNVGKSNRYYQGGL